MKSMFKSALGALIVVLALSGLTAASALAAGAPIVETKPATSVFGTEATLNGTVEAEGAKYYFEYGTTTSYGSKTTEARDLGKLKLEVNKTVTGLEPKTGYHFRIVATNVLGTSYGADQAFTTTAAALPEFSLSNTKEKLPASFEGVGGSASWSSPGYAFTCNSTTMAGTISAAKAVTKGSLVFNGCKVGANKCHSEGSENNEQIKTGPLEGTLAYISKTAKTVGMDFKAEGSEYWTTMICFGGSRQRVRGSIVIPITSVNKLTTKFTLTARGSGGSYEDESGLKHTVKLEAESVGGPEFEPLSWEFEDSLTTNKNIEIKA